jgi:hypothetical protein
MLAAFFLPGFLLTPRILAQTPSGGVKGTVIDRETREGLPNVTVVVIGTQSGASTDEKGKFSLTGLPAGTYSLQFRLVGYDPLVRTDVSVTPGKTASVQAELHERGVVAEEMTVTGGYFGSEEAIEAMSVGFNAEEIRRSPGSANDVSRILMALPSTAKVADNSNDLAVRGGSPVENGFYVDGIPVPNINHFPTQGSTGGPIGILNIDFIDQVDFLISGFSASYGDRLSSVVDIDYKDGTADDLYGKAFLSFAGFGAMAEGQLPSEGGSWMVSASKSYLDLIVGAIGTGVAPNYGDVQGKVILKLDDRHSLRLLAIGGKSAIDFDKETAVDDGQRQYGTNENSQGTLGLRWDALWSTGHYATTTLSYSGASYDNDFLKVATDRPYLTSANTDRNAVFRTVHFVQISKSFRLETGLEGKTEIGEFDTFFASDTNRLGQVEPDRIVDGRLTSFAGSVFATGIVSLSDRWTLSAGARAEYFELNRSLTVSPRLALSFAAAGDLTLHLRGGLFTQQVPLIVVAGRQEFQDLPVMRAYHVSVGADYMLRPDTKLTLEAYAKEYRDLPLDAGDPTLSVVDDGLFNQRFRVYDDLSGSGRAYTRGIEFILQRKMSDGIYGIASGSYSRSRYSDVFGVWRDRVYDNRWIFSVIGGYKPDQDWEYSIRWTYAGGGPYTPFDQQASTAANIGIIDQARVNAERYPDYHSLNLRVDRKFYFASHMLDIYLSVWNAYNRKNVAGYFWNATENRQDTQYQWSVLPVLGVEYEF